MEEYKKIEGIDASILVYNGIRRNSVAREPMTAEWVRSLGDGVFYDVGANIGAYSLIAAKYNHGLTVYSFEPMYKNYFILMQNIIINNLSDRINAFNCAISKNNEINKFNYHSLEAGSALSSFGAPIDYKGDVFCPAFIQSVFSFSIDFLVDNYNLPSPDFVKIDVDSIEYDIVLGMKNCLKNSIKSILIEGDNRQFEKFNPVIENFGFKLLKEEKHKLTNNYLYKL
jgi:FkbM family methyltransferase